MKICRLNRSVLRLQLLKKKMAASTWIPFFFRRITCLSSLSRYNGFASSAAAEVTNLNASQSLREEAKGTTRNIDTKLKTHNLVSSAFASILLENQSSDIQTPYTDQKITNATSVDELLSISEGTGVSRKHALKVVSVLSNWTTNGTVKLTDFETDPRFIRLCKILTRGFAPNTVRKSVISKSEDLSTILSVTADEEAAKMVENITLQQMVKVMITLSIRKRRSKLLLRALAYNIAASTERLDIKQCADLLFSMSTLNFCEDNLFESISNNIIYLLKGDIVRKSAVIGSILTSVGLLKYNHPALLDSLSAWVVRNHAICRPQDIFSLFMTLAVLYYIPLNSETLFKVLIPQLTQEEAGKPLVWLEVVWSLVLLDQANANHIKTILNKSFIDSLQKHRSFSISVYLKLLNIDGAARYLIENYDGPKLEPTVDFRNTKIILSNDKYEMVNSVIETLKNLISDRYVRTRINTGLGFYIDAECMLDKKCNPQPLEVPNMIVDSTRIAVQTYDYHDMCRGRTELTGINVLSQRLLKAMGYKVVSVPYMEFKPTDKIVHRVQYLESKLKEAVQ